MTALILEPYGRAVVVKGDTRAVKDFLKEKGGKWNKGLVGWIFPGSRASQLAADLRSQGSTVEDRTGAGGGGGAAAAGAPASKAAKRPAPDAEPAAAAKRPKAAPEADDGEKIIEIADKLRGTISSFNGSVGVDIRKFYVDRGSNELRPTAKGIRLKTEEWQALCKAMPEVEAALAGQEPEVRLQTTEDIIVTVKASEGGGGKSVDVRRFWTDRTDGELKPGKKGVFLSQLEWSGVKASSQEIGEALRGGGGAASAAAAPAPRRVVAKDAAASPAPRKAPPAEGRGEGEHLRERLADLLRGRDLQALSLKTVRGELEADLGMVKGALDSRREEIKGIVTDLLNRGIP